MKHINFYIITTCCILSGISMQAQEILIVINKKYLNIPVSNQARNAPMKFVIDGVQERQFNVNLANSTVDYWVFCDMSAFTGKTIKISFPGNQTGLDKIYQTDQIAGQDSLYNEKNRPQFHFSSRRGWLNDPNGLVYYDGEYHLFYQHNPYGTGWGNMHWGHAVSPDLIHWKELPIALYPDEHGTMFSGSAIIDYDNTAGFNKRETPAMIAIYTANNGSREVQCIAYSLDRGRTWEKYDKNPVIATNEQANDTRDPKVFWYEPNKRWVMALYEKDGISIYSSKDLKEWTYHSRTPGFYECPDLFELPVDGNPSVKKWVMYGGSGTYMVGMFDGKKFTPESGKHYYCAGPQYAAQTFSNIPASDGRRIQIGWGRGIEHSGMPFNQMMLLPTELSLRTTKNGVRMFSTLVKEVETLQDKTYSWNMLSIDKANELLKQFNDEDYLRIKATISLDRARDCGLSLDGQNILNYEFSYSRINGVFYSAENHSGLEFTVDIIIDKTSVELFIDNGLLSHSMVRKAVSEKAIGLQFWGSAWGNTVIKELTVHTLKSIWT